MANWNTLKTAVADVINANGKQSITGQLLQNVLNNIITNVGENATFAGIATLDTNPGAPDGPVFYLTATAGTYPNFNGIEVQDGEAVILLWNNNVWSKKVTGFATQEKLSQLGSSINNETIRAKEAEEELENSINANRYGYNVTVNGLKGGIHTIETAIKDVPSKFRMLGQKITFRTENGDWATYHNESLSLDNYTNTDDWVQEVGISSVTGDINITNAPDYEDLTEAADSTLKFADKEYSAESFSGLGRVYLRKNIVDGVNELTQDMFVKPNTVYIIQYDYDLNAAEITIPENCVLDFQGGSLSNGSINNVSIKYSPSYIFRNLKITCAVDSYITPFNFGAKLDGVTDDTNALNDFFKCLYLSRCLHGGSGTAYITNTVIVPCGCFLPELNFICDNGFSKPVVYIDNYRFDTDIDTQSEGNMLQNCNITIGSVKCNGWGTENSCGIKVSAAKHIVVNAIEIKQLGAGLLLEGYDRGCGWISYSTFNIKYILNCKSGLKFRQYKKYEERKAGWVTECVFNDTHINERSNGVWAETIGIDMQNDEGNTFDGHKFMNICLEGIQDTENTVKWIIVFKNAVLNNFYNCRFEGSKEGGIRRILKDVNENPYANTFIGCIGDLYNTIFEGYREGMDRYYNVLSPMYSGVFKTNGPLGMYGRDIETEDFTKMITGLRAYGYPIHDPHESFTTTSGGGLAVIPSINDGARNGSFILWRPCSSDKNLYFRRGKSKDDGTGKHFYDWEMILKRNVSAKITGSTRIPSNSNDYNEGDTYIGSQGLQTKIGDEWYNIYGHNGAPKVGVNYLPTKAYLGASIIISLDTYKGYPAFYIGSDTEELKDKWIEYDGERIGILRAGVTANRPNPSRKGFQYFDETLNKPIWWNGTAWVDATGAEV